MKWRDIKLLIEADSVRNGGGKNFVSFVIKNVFGSRNTSLQFLFWLRLCSANNKILRSIAKIQRVRLTRKYGLQIPEHCLIGEGLELPHAMSIVVHYNAKIGKNCTMHQFVTIGGDGKGYAPTIGNNCFIGAGAVIIGRVVIGNNVTIGANAVVCKDIPDNATVGGVPVKVLHYKHPAKYIKNPI